MPKQAGIDIVQQAGTIYIIDGNGKALLGFSVEAAEILCLRLVNCIRETKGLNHIEAGALGKVTVNEN